jgi:hypothetical protein
MKIKQVNFKFSDTKKKWWQFWKKDTVCRWSQDRFKSILKVFDKHVKWDKLVNVVMSPDAFTVCSTITYEGENDKYSSLIIPLNPDQPASFEKLLNYHGTYACLNDIYATDLDDKTKKGCTYIAFRYSDGSCLIINFTEALFVELKEGCSTDW